MRVVFIILLSLYGFQSNAQYVSFEEEKEIIRATLHQYLDTNPNSLASYIKGNEGYEMMEFGLKMGLVFEEDSAKKEEIRLVYDSIPYFSDSITEVLKTKKITIEIEDTLYVYRYTPGATDLRTSDGWNERYNSFYEDFVENDLARFQDSIGAEYIDLVRKQVNYDGKDVPIILSSFDQSYYRFSTSCSDELCMRGIKLYRAVFNETKDKACYLFSYYCRDLEECRSFIFIEKVKNQWKYVDDYPSWIVDEL